MFKWLIAPSCGVEQNACHFHSQLAISILVVKKLCFYDLPFRIYFYVLLWKQKVQLSRAWENFYNSTQTSENLVLESFFDGEFDFDTIFWLQGQDQGENYDFQGKIVQFSNISNYGCTRLKVLKFWSQEPFLARNLTIIPIFSDKVKKKNSKFFGIEFIN